MGNSVKNILFRCMSLNFSASLPLAPYNREHLLERRRLAGWSPVALSGERTGTQSQVHRASPGPVHALLPLQGCLMPSAHQVLGTV